jgi:ketosteroid isomerase-like protein
MPLDLSAPLAAYFAASNAHDADALLSLFADHASVRDEGREMIGLAAIRGWAEGTFRDYRITITSNEAEQLGDATVVRAQVAGAFPGSPVILPFRFEIADRKITMLGIG